MREVKVTNLVKFYTILLLSENPKHGYEIIKEVRKKIGKRVSAGEIYPFLKLLRKHGYIESKKTETRKKKVYHLTGRGKEFVKKMLERFGDLISIAIKPRLTICFHCGCKIYEGGYKKESKGRMLTFCCYHCAKSFMKKVV